MNSSRMNRLEELGRVDAEKARTRKGKKNLKAEKKRIVRELKADGGRVMGRGQGRVRIEPLPACLPTDGFTLSITGNSKPLSSNISPS